MSDLPPPETFEEPEGPRLPWSPIDEELRAETRAELLKRVTVTLLVLGVLGLVGWMAHTTYLIRDSQLSGRTTLQEAHDAAEASERASEEAKRTAERVESCTTPKGDCYERGQRSTSGAIAGINTVTVRASACTLAITKAIPDGTQVNVDEIAAEIEECIRTSRVSVAPQRVVPAPESPVRPKKAATSPADPKPGKGPKKPKPPKPKPSTPPSNQSSTLVCVLDICLPRLFL